MSDWAYYDHKHEPHQIYGTAATSSEVEELRSLAAGLREDLQSAEQRIRELETAFAVHHHPAQAGGAL